MFIQTLAIAAAAASVAPAVLAQSAGAPTAATTVADDDLYASCLEKLGASGTHSLLDILTNAVPAIANNGEDSVLAPLVEEVKPATLALLDDFDVTGVMSYTLMLPLNDDGMGNLLEEQFELNSTEVIAAADDIIRAHIIPETLTYTDIQEGTNATGELIVESLEGFMWTFGWKEQGADGGGFAFLVDEWNVTTTGEIPLVFDINVEPDCPNRIIGVRGFMVTPDELTAPTPAPVAAPPPTVDEPEVEPTPPVTTTETTTEAESTPSGARGVATSGLAMLSAFGAAALGAVIM